MDSEEAELKKLRWRCRRGMLELDLLLVPFFDARFAELSIEQRRTFTKLLDHEDPDLLVWLTGRATPDDAKLAEMVDLILIYVKQSS